MDSKTKKKILGIELGSTRIKSVIIGEDFTPMASGDFVWQSKFENGIWTYNLEDAWRGIKTSLSKLGGLSADVDIAGISAMMHGYLAFDKDWNLLVPFRTWQNTITGEAAEELTTLFNFNIPQRWSIAHTYQAILNGEEHIKKLAHVTTLSGYITYKLTGVNAVGLGEASGMFPIDQATGQFNTGMIEKFDNLIADKGYPWKLADILPAVASAGAEAGTLTEEGARMLDEKGVLKAGIPFCPPEGDAGTGMTATNAVKQRTGNVSAGTSVFSMVVLEKDLSKPYEEIDIVTTPTGDPVAMVHCNNCTSDINAWVNLFDEFANLCGNPIDKNTLYTKLFTVALDGDADCGGLVSYNYFSGEPVTGFDEGAPLFVRKADDKFTLANFMRMHIYSSLAALKYGLDLMFKEEGVKCDEMFGHGGLFKTPKVGQSIAAAAMNAPVSVMDTAGEGGPWGMALLAAFGDARKKDNSLTLPVFLNDRIFAGNKGSKIEPDADAVKGFDKFMERYVRGLAAEKAALDI